MLTGLDCKNNKMAPGYIHNIKSLNRDRRVIVREGLFSRELLLRIASRIPSVRLVARGLPEGPSSDAGTIAV